MKIRKLLVVILIVTVISVAFAKIDFAAQESFSYTLNTANGELAPGDVFDVTVSLNNFSNIEKGITAITGKLEYNKDVLEIVPIVEGNVEQKIEEVILKGQNEWNISYNKEKQLFVGDSRQVKSDSSLFNVRFRVKSSITDSTTATINIVDVSASEGNGIIYIENKAPYKVNVVVKKYTDIIINDYKVDEKKVSEIKENTKLSEFKKKIENPGNLPIVFKNKDGKVLTDDSLVGTGTTITVGEDNIYTLCVKGDTDGNGLTTANDLAQLKLHLIDLIKLTGVRLEAAELDNLSSVTINDLAKMKLVLIGKATV